MNNSMNTMEETEKMEATEKPILHIRKSITTGGFEASITHRGSHKAGFIGGNIDEVIENSKRWCKQLGIEDVRINTEGENLTGETSMDNNTAVEIKRLLES